MIRFRTPRHAEAETLTGIALASKRLWNYPEEWIALWEPSLRVTPEQLDAWHFEVAEAGEALVGYFAVSRDGALAELEHLWVKPGYEGRGYGRLILRRALARCRELGATRLRVVSDPNAEGFYRRMGGVLSGQVPSVPEPRMLPVLEFHLSAAGA
ncbi:MAG: GNAT family N-acetyltransferase [Gammaproteobacteria bacterium]|nr:GNAT family N-acetyltransferase [Gammaproteobacteria bacterium]